MYTYITQQKILRKIVMDTTSCVKISQRCINFTQGCINFIHTWENFSQLSCVNGNLYNFE